MKLVLKVCGVILILLVIVGTINGGWKASKPQADPQRFVRIGKQRVFIPTDTPRNIFAETSALMGQMGYMPWYRACVIGQARRLLTPQKIKRFAGLPEAQKESAKLSFFLQAAPHCEGSGREVVDPNAAPRQLLLIRIQSAAIVKAIFAKSPQAFRNCAVRQIQQATDTQTLLLANGSAGTQEALFAELFKPCA